MKRTVLLLSAVLLIMVGLWAPAVSAGRPTSDVPTYPMRVWAVLHVSIKDRKGTDCAGITPHVYIEPCPGCHVVVIFHGQEIDGGLPNDVPAFLVGDLQVLENGCQVFQVYDAWPCLEY